MHLWQLYSFLAFAFSLFSTAAASPDALNVTVLGAANNHSTLECWSLEPGFTVSPQAGTAGSEVLSLGLLGGTNASYVVVPAEFDGGGHNAPAVQWVVFLSGLAHITLPHSKHEAWIRGGKHGTILALDTAAVSADGHNTTYPSRDITIGLQLPIAGGKIPEHEFLHMGACRHEELEL
ncbi:hypothetical protein ARAM_005938 [Aspergillus rambellii]|uniref:Small secreted protein n=2 Tax=Aspergillus subgen. Nidulantes TaxID=2720870 RepID=A0A0F8X9D4_9EURO|nr:hypothetical protein ARAM_005938 [Aspergillus rambellii]